MTGWQFSEQVVNIAMILFQVSTRIWIVILTLIMVSGSAIVKANVCVPAGGEPLRIGAVFPPDNLFGTDAADPYRGVQAMVAAFNACGGLNDRPIELVYAPARNYEEAIAAVDTLGGDVPVIVGSGSAVVSEVLAKAAGEADYFYWEVTEPLDTAHAYALSSRPNSAQLGAQGAVFVEGSEVGSLLNSGESLGIALVYEDNPRARAAAAGVRQSLQQPPLIDAEIPKRWDDTYPLAVQMRERGVNVLIVAAFEYDADRLWSSVRQADANLAAWVQVGGDEYHDNMCSRIGNTDGIMTISAAGAVSDEYRDMAFPTFYEFYVSSYEAQFGRRPGQRADLAASGMLILLREILPYVRGDIVPASIPAATLNITGAGNGLMSESWSLDTTTWVNRAAVAIVAQQQAGAFCSIAPGAVATCELPLQPFPTWRERARTTSC